MNLSSLSRFKADTPRRRYQDRSRRPGSSPAPIGPLLCAAITGESSSSQYRSPLHARPSIAPPAAFALHLDEGLGVSLPPAAGRAALRPPSLRYGATRSRLPFPPRRGAVSALTGDGRFCNRTLPSSPFEFQRPHRDRSFTKERLRVGLCPSPCENPLRHRQHVIFI